jgi:glucose-6-phosphate 1-dehydrogenase
MMSHSSETLDPTVITIFGVSGNLAQIKLLPALYHLLKKDMLPAECIVVGVFRPTSITPEELMTRLKHALERKGITADPAIMQRLAAIFRPITMDSTEEADYQKLRDMLDDLDKTAGVRHQRLFYLAIPPTIFPKVLHNLYKAGLHKEERAARRLLVEKPFGTNLASARKLVTTMAEYFDERQIYRIDHYLAKENAQNILTFRFNNPIIEDVWGRQFIDHIQITASESIGIDARGNFYDGMGALRDIVQSHLLQLMALTMMEAPETMSSKHIHEEKLALLSSIQVIKPSHVDEQVVRGQYEGYRDEAHNPDSTTETFVALQLEVNNPRWSGVPVLLRTGKAMSKQLTEINVVFRDRSRRMVPPNILTIRIQPNEGIGMRLTAKKPGFSAQMQPVDMAFTYQNSFDADSPDAYERVIVDAVAGDQSLFASSEEVLRCWEVLEPILEHWQSGKSTPPVLYPKGTSGPSCSDDLAANFSCEWM